MNLFRTSGDIRPQWGSILTNLMTTTEFNAGTSAARARAHVDMYVDMYVDTLNTEPFLWGTRWRTKSNIALR